MPPYDTQISDILLSQVHWSEDDMSHALDSVRTGNMSINQVSVESSCSLQEMID